MRVIVDMDQCEANALCVAIAPGVFELNADDDLTVLDEHPTQNTWTAVKRAVAACPMQAIRFAGD